MWQPYQNATVRLGGCVFINTPILLAYELKPFISLVANSANGHIGIDCLIYNQNGELVAKVKHNQIYPTRENNDKYEIGGGAHSSFLLDRNSQQKLVNIHIREEAAPHHVDMSADLFLPNGMRFKATEDSFEFVGVSFEGGKFQNLAVGINVNSDGSAGVGYPPGYENDDPPVPWFDPAEEEL